MFVFFFTNYDSLSSFNIIIILERGQCFANISVWNGVIINCLTQEEAMIYQRLEIAIFFSEQNCRLAIIRVYLFGLNYIEVVNKICYAGRY